VRRALAVAVGAAVFALVPAGIADAHPLGNFTVNHSDALLFTPDGVDLRAVVDRAEIPTAQALLDIAPDGEPSAAALARTAAVECGALADDVVLTVDGSRVPWQVGVTTLEVVPGTAGLPTLRLTCSLRSDADLTGQSRIAFADGYESGRIGWREITADGAGVRLLDSPVPVESPSDELRSYPADLLQSPIDVRGFEVATEPGKNTGPGPVPERRSGDLFAGTLAALDRRLAGLIGDDGLTPTVGLLALGLAVLLGCGHALLPGHGKTVMAAYLAGRRGRPRDAVLVGATVTATHTVGVLVLGLAVSVSSAFAGDQVLRWLGVVSGALVALIGAGMLRGALRDGRSPAPWPEPLVGTRPAVPALAGAVAHGHDHPHGHDHHDHAAGDVQPAWSAAHEHGPATHTHGPGRGGLVGMGIAGGLVPSPSALVVLLASVALGRTVFGVLLVVAYGLGMAATLTAVGLALVRLRDRVSDRLPTNRATTLLRFLSRAAPLVTASMVLVVGLALVVRGVALSS
jgi:ABC-type nickel/cobalt efflux system permease component RcnA